AGGVWFYTNSGLTAGARLPSGSGTWASLSDSTMKRRLGSVNTRDILNKVTALPIERWSYKTQDEKIQHIGPMAQEFNKTFCVGDDSRMISGGDPDGIALAAIQELAKENQLLRAENDKQQSTNDKLEAEIAELRAAVQSLQANQKQTNLK